MTFESDPICIHAPVMSEPFSMILFENKHNTWLIPVKLLKHQCKSSFIQKYTKIKICVFIAVKTVYIMILFIDELVTVFRRKQKRCMRSIYSNYPVS